MRKIPFLTAAYARASNTTQINETKKRCQRWIMIEVPIKEDQEKPGKKAQNTPFPNEKTLKKEKTVEKPPKNTATHDQP